MNTNSDVSRAVVIGATIIGAGLFMTILGYFDRDLTTTSIFNITTGDEILVVDLSLRYKLKMMQYIGPVLMGFGTFLLIIACVITLESRDRHAMVNISISFPSNLTHFLDYSRGV